jgi:hypothetical protein
MRMFCFSLLLPHVCICLSRLNAEWQFYQPTNAIFAAHGLIDSIYVITYLWYVNNMISNAIAPFGKDNCFECSIKIALILKGQLIDMVYWNIGVLKYLSS